MTVTIKRKSMKKSSKKNVSSRKRSNKTRKNLSKIVVEVERKTNSKTKNHMIKKQDNI